MDEKVVGKRFGTPVDDPNNPLSAKPTKLNQPISIIFGEGGTNGCPDNKSAEVILDVNGKPKGLRTNQQHGYTEATDLSVIKQPISTRFGDPLNKDTISLPPPPQRKEVKFPSRARAPVKTKPADRPFLDF